MKNPNAKEVALINTMLSKVSVKHESVKEQMLFERGYLTGFLASLAAGDSYIRRRINERITQLDRNRGGR